MDDISRGAVMFHHRRDGLTLTELIVVIMIIALLMALLLPAVRKVREPANRMLCQSNLRQLMIATHNYHNDYNCLPKGCRGPGASPEERLSWMVTILPYLESDSVFKSINQELNYFGNLKAVDVKMKQYQCVSADTSLVPVTHYVAMAGVGLDAANRPVDTPGIGFMGYERQTTLGKITVMDGTSNTIGLMETRLDLGHWARGGWNTLRGYEPSTMKLEGDNPAFSGHANGTNAVMLDASIRNIRKTIAPKVLAALITIDGKEQVDMSAAFD
jgi:prepilin-type N-terminal cleavage/methylation domain-containing protein